MVFCHCGNRCSCLTSPRRRAEGNEEIIRSGAVVKESRAVLLLCHCFACSPAALPISSISCLCMSGNICLFPPCADLTVWRRMRSSSATPFRVAGRVCGVWGAFRRTASCSIFRCWAGRWDTSCRRFCRTGRVGARSPGSCAVLWAMPGGMDCFLGGGCVGVGLGMRLYGGA